MKIITFDLCAKTAHFRKYYSNSTALSYIIPPITTIKGIIAGLLGYERDSYYEVFSNENTKISIGVSSRIKKITNVVNLLKVERTNDLSGRGLNRTQNDTEFIIPQDIRAGEVRYTVSFYHTDEDLMNRFAKLIVSDDLCFGSKGTALSLGAAYCLGWIENARIENAHSVISDGNDFIKLFGAVPTNAIDKFDYKNAIELSLAKEEFMTEFDSQRRITENSKAVVIVNLGSDLINVKLKAGTEYFRTESTNIMFIG